MDVSTRLKVGLGDPRGLFQADWFCVSVIALQRLLVKCVVLALGLDNSTNMGVRASLWGLATCSLSSRQHGVHARTHQQKEQSSPERFNGAIKRFLTPI